MFKIINKTEEINKILQKLELDWDDLKWFIKWNNKSMNNSLLDFYFKSIKDPFNSIINELNKYKDKNLDEIYISSISNSQDLNYSSKMETFDLKNSFDKFDSISKNNNSNQLNFNIYSYLNKQDQLGLKKIFKKKITKKNLKSRSISLYKNFIKNNLNT